MVPQIICYLFFYVPLLYVRTSNITQLDKVIYLIKYMVVNNWLLNPSVYFDSPLETIILVLFVYIFTLRLCCRHIYVSLSV